MATVSVWKKGLWARLWIRLLLLDRPVATGTAAEISQEIARNYRVNFAANFMDGLLFWFGIAFVSSATIIPLFVSKLTDDRMVLGLVAMIAQSSWYVPQVLTAGAIEQLGRKKPVVINVGLILERIPMWMLPLAAALALYSPILALVLFLVGYAWHGLGAGAIAPAWQDLFASCIPLEKRGFLFGLTAFAGTGVAVLGAEFSSWILDHYPYPTNFVVTFGIAALAITLSWIFLLFVREPANLVDAPPRLERPGLGRMWEIVIADNNFRQYLIARLWAMLGTMATGFITVYAIQEWGAPDSAVGRFTAILLLGQTAGNLMAGVVADRLGHKVPLVIGGIAQVAAVGWALLAQSAEGLYPVYFLLGVHAGVHVVSGLLVSMEFATPERRPSYVGIANTAVGVGSAVAPLVGGWIATAGYPALFSASACAAFVGLIWLLLAVRDPRKREAAMQRV